MKQFALIVGGRVTEVVDEFVVVGEGDESVNVPLEDRYSPEFVAQLVEYDAANPPAEPPAPEIPVPVVLTMRQARLALLASGKLPAVDAAITALPVGQREAARIEWEYAATVERSSALVQMLADALSLDMDELFLAGAAL